MGDWYVIAHIPIFLEKDAHNAIERYELIEPHLVQIEFSFNDESLDGATKVYRAQAGVEPENQRQWWPVFIWPFRADFKIAYVDNQYETTIIARDARDYVWLMTRSPEISDEQYDDMVKLIQDLGYDIRKLRRIPHDSVSITTE